MASVHRFNIKNFYIPHNIFMRKRKGKKVSFMNNETLNNKETTATNSLDPILELRDPFSNMELSDTENLIIHNRLLNGQSPCGFILGTPGSGVTFTAKSEMLYVMLNSNAKCIVIDPESEYGAFAKQFGGEVIKIIPDGKWHINPMEIKMSNDLNVEESDLVLSKTDFILRLMEVMIKSPFGLTPVQKAIIDECVNALYKPFMKNGILQPIPADQMPTLTDLQVAISQRKTSEAREIAYALKLYTGNSSLNTFGFQSNVQTDNRFVVYDIKDVGDELKPIAMLIVLDSIQNELFLNRNRDRKTWLWIDKIHRLIKDERTGSFLWTLFKRARTYRCVPTGITQHVEELLENEIARRMLSNCNFIQLLNQTSSDREKLRYLFNLSDSQVNVITSASCGQGIIITGSNCVAFNIKVPKKPPIWHIHAFNDVFNLSEI